MANDLDPAKNREILKMECRSGDDRFWIEGEIKTFKIQENYVVVGERTLYLISHIFPNTIYGVSCLAGLLPNEAHMLGKSLVDWAEAMDPELKGPAE